MGTSIESHRKSLARAQTQVSPPVFRTCITSFYSTVGLAKRSLMIREMRAEMIDELIGSSLTESSRSCHSCKRWPTKCLIYNNVT